MGAGERSTEGVICYELGAAAATRRARALAAVGAFAGVLPLLLAVGLFRHVAWTPSALFWLGLALVTLLVSARTAVQYGAIKRRLRALRVVLDDHAIATQTGTEVYAIPRAQVARIVEIDGSLGGLRVVSRPEPRNGAVQVASVPRGGDRFNQIRAKLEEWHAIERRRRRGPLSRFFLGLVIVAVIFFLPFVLDDFAARSNLVTGILVVLAWVSMRWALRS